MTTSRRAEQQKGKAQQVREARGDPTLDDDTIKSEVGTN